MRMTEVFLAIAAVIILIQQAVILAGRAKRKKAERLERLAGLAASGDTHAQAELEHQGGSKAAQARMVLHVCEREAKSGDCGAMLRLAKLYEAGESKEDARVWFERAAEKGNVAAMLALAKGFDEDGFLDTDLDEAFRWYHAAAQGGNSEAQYRLGVCYEYGLGTGGDLARAIECYRLAICGGETLLPRMCLARIYGNPDSGFYSIAEWRAQRDALLKAMRSAGAARCDADYAKAAQCLGHLYGEPWITGWNLAPGLANKRRAAYLFFWRKRRARRRQEMC